MVFDEGVVIVMGIPGDEDLVGVLGALREWQHDDAPMQLHPGDLGWFWRFGVRATAQAVRVWRREEQVVAVGLLDGPGLVRLTTSPDARTDPDLADQLAADLTEPGRGVLPAGRANVEAPADALLQRRLAEAGWAVDEPWTPLRCDLAEPTEDPGVRIEVVGPESADDVASVVRGSFERSTFTDERWHDIASGPAYADARCLLARDESGVPAATVTVWSAGPGRPGLVEPMGVHRDHRGRGLGRAITLAGAAALRELGSSSALVCTPSANVGGVATYGAAGFQPLPEVRDRVRDV